MNSIQITIKGLPEDKGRELGETVGWMISQARTFNLPLDMRRLIRVIITNDFRAEISTFSSERGKAIDFTDRNDALCVGKVLCERAEDDFAITLVLDNRIVAFLLNEDQEACRYAFHLLHHELCHVHDDNVQMDLLKDVFLTKQWTGVAGYTGPLAELLWSEYFATRTSAGSASPRNVNDQIDLLRGAVMTIKPTIDQLILSYRYGGTVDLLLEGALPHAKFLLRSAAYILGYLDGPLKSMHDVPHTVSSFIEGSYFQPIWVRLTDELRSLYSAYPNWNGLGVYDGLTKIVKEYLEVLGLEFRDIPGGVYVNVPYRPENTPPDAFLRFS